MKYRLITIFLLLLCTGMVIAQGIPAIRNFTVEDYRANSLNYDITIGADGTVFVANFEGLLYYDKARWRILYTPGISRVTNIYRDKDDTIWVGGYNFFGKIRKTDNGQLYLQRVGRENSFSGEIKEIWTNGQSGRINFLVNRAEKNILFQAEGDEVSAVTEITDSSERLGSFDIVSTDSLDKEKKISIRTDIIKTEPIGNGMTAVIRKGQGIIILGQDGEELYRITKDNGLLSNNIGWIAYDGHGTLWGIANECVFAIGVPSAYSRFTSFEGLSGHILSIEEYRGEKYVGTNNGLFRQQGRAFRHISGVDYACWDLEVAGSQLMAATSNGIYRIANDGKAAQMTTSGSMSLLADTLGLYSGESDGVFLVQAATGYRRKVCDLEKVTKMLKDRDGTIWLQNLYGEIWRKEASHNSFAAYQAENSSASAATIVPLGDNVKVVNALDSEPFPYPLFSYEDTSGTTWLTDNEGKHLYPWKDNQRQDNLAPLLYPFHQMTISAMSCQGDEIWLGGNNSLWVIDKHADDPMQKTKPRLYFRSISLNNDSILWGGFGDIPESLPDLESHERTLFFTYALDYVPLVGNVRYRYKLNDGDWGLWEDDNDTELVNLTWGAYTMSVQALLPTGELSDIITVRFFINYPFYLRWYMMVLYLLLLLMITYGIFRLRLRRLNREKLRLEQVVKERTTEIVKQKDEIEEKSVRLEKALDDLGNAQAKLIHQEKMATVGKLTQGLIDRILNPLNYINNFSKLSEGLVKDLEANIEDEKERMDKENYEDTVDVLGMLRGNLQKVSEHGQNTTRTLKAMEEMLKDRSGGVTKTDLTDILRQNEKMLANYYAQPISEHHIKTLFDYPSAPVFVIVNPDLLSKVIMSLLGNSIYAVIKKSQRIDCQPEVSVVASSGNDTDTVTITVRDTGIGIEENIIHKVFDPFFTTKTTGEASGIGLYLSHDIIHNYGGDITVKSVKDEYTEFTIKLPILKD